MVSSNVRRVAAVPSWECTMCVFQQRRRGIDGDHATETNVQGSVSLSILAVM
jgi:hypothetical protein